MRPWHNDVRRAIELGLFSDCLFETVARDITCHNLHAGCDSRDGSIPGTMSVADAESKSNMTRKGKRRYSKVR